MINNDVESGRQNKNRNDSIDLANEVNSFYAP